MANFSLSGLIYKIGNSKQVYWKSYSQRAILSVFQIDQQPRNASTCGTLIETLRFLLQLTKTFPQSTLKLVVYPKNQGVPTNDSIVYLVFIHPLHQMAQLRTAQLLISCAWERSKNFRSTPCQQMKDCVHVECLLFIFFVENTKPQSTNAPPVSVVLLNQCF